MILARVRRIFDSTRLGVFGCWRPEVPGALERPNGWQMISEGPPDGTSPNGYFLIALPDANPSEIVEVQLQSGADVFRPDELARLPQHWRPLADSQLLGWERRGR